MNMCVFTKKLWNREPVAIMGKKSGRRNEHVCVFTESCGTEDRWPLWVIRVEEWKETIDTQKVVRWWWQATLRRSRWPLTVVISSHAGSNKRGASSTATMERVPISTDISNKHNIGASTSENHSIQSVCFEKKDRANEQEQSYRTIITITHREWRHRGCGFCADRPLIGR